MFTPNSAFFRFSPRRLMLQVAAFRNIEPGEEITINCKSERESHVMSCRG